MTPSTALQPYDFEAAQIREAGAQLAEQAELLVISDDETDLAAKTVLATVTKGLKAADERRKELKAPAMAECRAIDEAFKTATVPFESAKKLIAVKAGDYFAAKRRAEEEARRESERAEREATAARAKAEAEAAAAGKDLEPVPVAKPAPVVPVAQSAVKTEAGTVGMVEQRGWEIADETVIPRDYFVLDTARIGKEIRGGGEIPGIKVVISYVPRTR